MTQPHSPELQKTLRRSVSRARDLRQAFATIEHLLLALTEDADALAIFRSDNVDIGALHAELTEFVEIHLRGLASPPVDEPKVTAGTTRILEAAERAVTAAGRAEVTGADVLLAVSVERESHGLNTLARHGLVHAGRPRYPASAEPQIPRTPRYTYGMTPTLQQTFDRAQSLAQARGSATIEVSHLMIALADDADTRHLLEKCDIDPDRLHDLMSRLGIGPTSLAPGVPPHYLGIERIIDRAALRMSARRPQIDGTDVLAEALADPDGAAVRYLLDRKFAQAEIDRLIGLGKRSSRRR